MTMQAGESLSFHRIPDVLAEPVQISEREALHIHQATIALMKAVFSKHESHVERITQYEDIGEVVVDEVLLKLPYDDGSYLHIAAFSHSTKKGVLDFGIALAEHSPEGINLGGYLYHVDAAEVSYRRLESLEDETYGDSYEHFSVHYAYRMANDIYNEQFSDDEETRIRAAREWAIVNESNSLDQIEMNLGFGKGTPTLHDIRMLADLLNDAALYANR